ncbi:MAG: glycine dehydrogenase, partial [Acidimicrobiales bacterium]
MGHFVPHTDVEIAQMLDFLGLPCLDDLFAVVPEALRLVSTAAGTTTPRYLDLEDGLSEPDVLAASRRLARANAWGDELVCFAGGGAYDHEVPAAVRRLAFRSEFVTAYTPYQPEVAQGVLQALFEYQTMVARLAGVAIANASLYDGASACVEAVNLAVAATGRSTVWVSTGLNPAWRAVVRTFAAGTGHDIVELPMPDGVTTLPDTGEPAAILVQHPNYLGCLEDLAMARAAATRSGAMLLVAFDPVAAGLLRSPGSYGADVVV